MGTPEIRNGEANKSKKPVEGSIFDRPGPLFPEFKPGKIHDFDQIMRGNPRIMMAIYGTAVVGLVAGFCGR